MRDGALHAHDAILEMLNLHEGGMQKLGSGTNETINGHATPRSHGGRPGQAA